MGDMYNEAGREATRKVVETTTTIHPDGKITVIRKETTNTVTGTQKSLTTKNKTAPTKEVLAIGWK